MKIYLIIKIWRLSKVENYFWRENSDGLWAKLRFAPIVGIHENLSEFLWKWRVFCTFPPMREIGWQKRKIPSDLLSMTARMKRRLSLKNENCFNACLKRWSLKHFWPRLTHETKKDRKMQLFLWCSENLNETFDIGTYSCTVFENYQKSLIDQLQLTFIFK